ncbi:hypothetical protein BKP57_13325 [Virgibacillus sp. 6R]|nr:hypothetical protein BKP57_13325 [Virgibacillus sp. 6R]
MTFIKQFLRMSASIIIAFLAIGHVIDLWAKYINIDVWQLAVIVCLMLVIGLYVVRCIEDY